MLFIDSTSAATRHDVYAIERNPPATVQATGATQVGMVEQFPWGPEGIYAIESPADFIEKYAPGGMSRTGAGYMSIAGKAWPVLKIARVVAADAAASTYTFASSTPTNILKADLKYKGAAGNSVTGTVSDADDGDANHFNLTIVVESTSGKTTDTFRNVNLSGIGADSVFDLTGCKLVGELTKLAAGRPVNGTFSFAGGSDGTVDGTDYTGTMGAADAGIALFEADPDIDLVITGDPGNALRAAVNSGLKSHADYMTDRIAIVNGNSGQTAAGARTDVASYRSKRVCYIDCWAYQRDDETKAERLVAPAPFFASVAANLSPSTSPSWKSATVRRLLGSITRLETARGQAAYLNELAGICTLQREPNGGYSFEAAVNTDYPNDRSTGSYKRTRMAHYIAKAVKAGIREYVDSPNVAFNQNDEVAAVDEFLDGLKKNAKTNPNALPHIVDYTMRDLKTFNTAASIANGEFTLPADIQISPDQKKIFFSIQIGETVKVQADL